jgi:hypothetical protein
VKIGPIEPGRVPEVPAINVRLTADDYLWVARLAEADGTSLSGYVRTLIRRHVGAQDATG